MIEYLLLFKSLHIIGAVAWFGGMFYLVRIFVYHVEAFQKPEYERKILIPQFQIMEQRVYKIICNPGMMITWIFGLLMITAYIQSQGIEWFRVNSWLHIKLLLVFILSGYQGYCGSMIKKLSEGQSPLTSYKMRLFNELPTIFLVSIVLIAVYRNTLNSLYAFIGIVIFGILLIGFTKWYQSVRNKS